MSIVFSWNCRKSFAMDAAWISFHFRIPWNNRANRWWLRIRCKYLRNHILFRENSYHRCKDATACMYNIFLVNRCNRLLITPIVFHLKNKLLSALLCMRCIICTIFIWLDFSVTLIICTYKTHFFHTFIPWYKCVKV